MCIRDSVYVSTAGDDTLAGPLWSGLQPPYALEPRANPWFRFGINNADGEDLAVWRALAWALTEGSERYALPTYDRDQVAAKMHVPRHEVVLVRWEYRIDVRQNTFGEADIGFVPAKACVRTLSLIHISVDIGQPAFPCSAGGRNPFARATLIQR